MNSIKPSFMTIIYRTHASAHSAYNAATKLNLLRTTKLTDNDLYMKNISYNQLSHSTDQTMHNGIKSAPFKIL